MTAAYVLFLLVVKHAVADLILQSRLTTGDKADLTSPKGYRHALDHALCTLLVCIFFAPIPWALGIAELDFVLHFIIDFSKTKIVRRYKIKYEGKAFWCIQGIDQIAHYSCYIFYVLLLTNHL